MIDSLSQFGEIWCVDFEFHAPDGERPEPIVMVAREIRLDRVIRMEASVLQCLTAAPFPTGPDSLFIAFYASAEIGCFLALGWKLPERILDLYAEFRNRTNGLSVPCGRGLLGALACHGLDAIEAAQKDTMRELAIGGGPFTAGERVALLDYCDSDVVSMVKLLPRMLPNIDVPRALLRGRYMAAAARIEWRGVPIDVETLTRLRENWVAIQGRLVSEIDLDYGVYVPSGIVLDPSTPLGAAIVQEAAEWGLEPYLLAEAAGEVWFEVKAAHAELLAAIQAARKATGLTPKRISSHENAGLDSSTWADLDVQSRVLASDYPALGIGRGFEAGAEYDETDYAGQLWALLREDNPPVKAKRDPAILTEAARRVREAGPRTLSRGLSFNTQRFADWLVERNIPWPRTATGALSLSDDSFRQMAKAHPQVASLRELRHTLGELRLEKLTVGLDGRNRCLLSAFSSRTGRNQPSNSKFIFGPSCWLRGLIKPEEDQAIAYVDWSQQEFGIGAALSGDPAMMKAYTSGDPYLTFAKQAGAVPDDATKETHPVERGQFKVCSLAVQYGMGPQSLAESLGQSVATGRELLALHKRTYDRFWKWSEAAVNRAMLLGSIHTVFGWEIHVGGEANPRSLANFPCQANGAELLRLACCLATEGGIEVLAPIHDALLIGGPIEEIDAIVRQTQAAMAEASRVVLDGFELRTDCEIVRWPDRYMDDRGAKMWGTIMDILDEVEKESWAGGGPTQEF